MNQQLRSILKFLLFLCIGIFLIWLSVHKLTETDKQDISNALQRADYGWIVLSIAIGLLSHVSRAIRWKMLMEPLGFKPKTSNTFFAVMIGYLANYAIPRLGEVSRCGVLTRYEKVPFSESFGTVVVERLVDVLTFILIAIIVFLIQFDVLFAYLREHFFTALSEKISSHGVSTYILLGGICLMIVIIIFFRNKIVNMLGAKAKLFIAQFIEGIKSIKQVKSPVFFILHSLFIWFIYYVAFHICLLCLAETKDISIGAGLTIFLVATLTIMITPGGLGAYPIAVASVISLYNVGFSIGTAFGWIVWLSQFVLILFFGLLSIVLLPLLNKEK